MPSQAKELMKKVCVLVLVLLTIMGKRLGFDDAARAAAANNHRTEVQGGVFNDATTQCC
jgi:hypothetical protein